MFIDSTIPVLSTAIFELEQPDGEDGYFKPGLSASSMGQPTTEADR
jgi:hypothetical protein